MNNCLVTTLKAAVNDNSLLRMGEMRIKISYIESPNEYSQSITLGFSKSVDLEIIGEGYFTDATLSANNGKKMPVLCHFFAQGASTAWVWVIFEKGGTLCVSQMLPPMIEPFPMVIRPNTEALE